MRRRFGLVLAALVVAASGCVLGVDFDGFSSKPDAGVVPDATTDAERNGSRDASPADAGADGAEKDDASCPVDHLVLGVSAATLTAVGGVTCNPTFVLVRDDKLAGLDRSAGADGTLAGKTVTGCVAVTLARVVSLTGVQVRASSVENACGASACQPVATGCGTGQTMSVFTGATPETLAVAGVLDTGAAADLTLSFPDGLRDVGVIAVCREGWGTARDDVGVDFIAGICE